MHTCRLVWAEKDH